MTQPSPLERLGRLQETQCTAEEAGQIALDDSVDTLGLTHILPYRDQITSRNPRRRSSTAR